MCYELFDLFTRCCVCVPYLGHNFALSFVSKALSLKINFFPLHNMVYCSFTFNSHIGTYKADIIRGNYELFDLLTHSFVCFAHFWHKFGFSFMSVAQLSKSRFFYFTLYIAPLALSCLFENKNTISYVQRMIFFIYSLALVCAFHICGTSLHFPSCLTPNFQNQVF